jgi:hypothetical protein
MATSLIGKAKNIGGKRFYCAFSIARKVDAINKAKSLRSRGYAARVSKGDTSYLVWTHPWKANY